MHTIVYKPLADIHAAEANPKRHEIDGIERSIIRFGFVAPAIIDARDRLVAGHGRIEALRQIQARGGALPKGIQSKGDAWLVPVISGVTLTAEEAAAYLIADNRLSEVGGWDASALQDLLGRVEASGIALSDVGFAPEAMSALSAEVASGAQVEREAPAEFKEVNASTITTTHECPKCSYRWSGPSK